MLRTEVRRGQWDGYGFVVCMGVGSTQRPINEVIVMSAQLLLWTLAATMSDGSWQTNSTKWYALGSCSFSSYWHVGRLVQPLTKAVKYIVAYFRRLSKEGSMSRSPSSHAKLIAHLPYPRMPCPQGHQSCPVVAAAPFLQVRQQGCRAIYRRRKSCSLPAVMLR